MKAVIFSKHGNPEVLQYTDYPTPSPKPGQVQVKLEAAALNRLDIWVRRGWPGIKLDYPHILGADGAGTISALGKGVRKVEIGERVVINPNISDGTCEYCLEGFENRCDNWQLLGETIHGTYCEYVCVPASNVIRVPENVDLHTAAAAALTFQTAWHSLIQRAKIKAGESILIVGASGGVNTASIQIAKLTGAIVYVVGSNESKLELAETLGADHLVNREVHEDWPKAIYKLTQKRGVDLVVDNVGTTFPLSLRAAKKGGRILTVGNTGGAKFEIDNRYIFGKHLSILGSTMSSQVDYIEVMGLVFSGKLKPHIGNTFPLSEARVAHEHLEAGKQLGKITLTIS